MKKLLIPILSFIVFLNDLAACTTFCLKDSKSLIYGRNYDFDFGCGFVVINRKGLNKTAFIQPPAIPAKWISKYGSITFNQIGIDLPMDGMNEKGLVIAQMGLFESKFPRPDNKPCVGGLEWIQYQLDNSSTLDEVIENNKIINIVPDIIPVHYLVCDSLGNVGIIEFINGQIKVYKGKDIIYPVLSNDTYDKSMNDLKEYKGFGGQKPIPIKWDNISEIIAKACNLINTYDANNPNIIDYGFNILAEVGSSARTQWSVIYDIRNKKIVFKSLQNRELRTISMSDFNFSCLNNIRLLDIQKSTSQEKIEKQFFDFSIDYYRNYLKILNKAFEDNIPGFPKITNEMFELQVNQPLTDKCI